MHAKHHLHEWHFIYLLELQQRGRFQVNNGLNIGLFMTQSWCMDHLYDGLWCFLVIKLDSPNSNSLRWKREARIILQSRVLNNTAFGFWVKFTLNMKILWLLLYYRFQLNVVWINIQTAEGRGFSWTTLNNVYLSYGLSNNIM